MPSLFIDAELRYAQFRDGLNKVSKEADTTANKIKRSFGGISSTFAGLGIALSAGGLAAFAKSGIDLADDLGKVSQKIGITTESLSALQYSASLSGVSFEGVQNAVKKMSTGMAEMQAGTGEAKDAFKALKINVEDSTGSLKTSEAVMLEIADKFAAMEDGAGKTALAVKLFGRAGVEMIPLLNQGAAGLKKNADEAERFGLIISGDAAKAAEEFNDNLTRLGSAVQGLKNYLVSIIIGPLADFTTSLLEAREATGGLAAGLNAMFNVTTFGDGPAEQIANITKELEKLEKQKSWFDGWLAQPLLGMRESNLLAALDIAKRNQIKQEPRDNFDLMGPGIRQKAPALAGSGSDSAAKKAQAEAKRLAAEAESFRKKMEQENIRSWVAAIDEQTREYEEGLRDQARALEDHNALVEKYRQIDAASWVAHIEEMQRQWEDELIAEAKLLDDETKKANRTAEELGLTFTSAFEDAVVGGKKFRDVLDGIAKDIARILIRKTVTKPLADAAGSFLDKALPSLLNFFGGARAMGGPVSAGMGYLVGEQGPELFMPGVSGSIIPNGGGAVNVVQNINVDSRSDRASINHAMAVARNQAASVVEDRSRRTVR